jgi:hypothetical protein
MWQFHDSSDGDACSLVVTAGILPAPLWRRQPSFERPGERRPRVGDGGAPPAIANAVVDALRHLGVTHLDIPITPEKVWQILKNKGVAE